MKLENKVAVVTGASSGMGRAIAKVFAQEGAHVIAVARRENMLKDLEAEAKDLPGTIDRFVGDVTVRATIDGMIDLAVNKFGKLDILVNNAGVADGNFPVAEMSDELWDRVIALDLTAVAFGCRKAVGIMEKQGSGIIINTASVGGLHGGIAGAAYVAAKHGVVGLTKNIGYMYQPKGIRCNAICPGGVLSEIITCGRGFETVSEWGNERMYKYYNSEIASTECENIASIALFLASDDSVFVNGTTLTADGGWTAY